MENPQKTTARKPGKLIRRIGMVLVAVLCLFGIKMLMGTRTMMYLYARDIDHIEVAVTPPGATLTATGTDMSSAVTLLSNAVTYGRKEPVAGQAISLTICNLDGSVQQVVVSGDYLEIDGRGYRMRLSDGEKIQAWAEALAEAQGVAPD